MLSFFRLNTKSLFIFLSVVIISLSVRDQYHEARTLHEKRKLKDYPLISKQMLDLEQPLKGQKIIGYYTDQNLRDKIPAARFAQIQLVLAPVVLAPDGLDLDYEFVLIDCASPRKMLEKIREIKFVPIAIHRNGIVLAKRMP